MDNSTKDLVKVLIEEAAKELFPCQLPPFKIERPKKKEWGDLSTNLPFLLSTISGKSSEKIGEDLASSLSRKSLFSRVEFVAPGFINFFLGPLHVGHGRAAALGDALANNLDKLGFKVQREYYVNNVGGQMNRLVRSLWVRIRQLEGEEVELPEDGYKGEYLVDIARAFRQKMGEVKKSSWEKIYPLLSRFVVEEILSDIKGDLERFGVRYDRWFFESEIYDNKELSRVLSYLREKNLVYEKNGALWFKTSAILKGEEDRVLRRKNGEYTYFASDIAYHLNKLKRGFYRVVDIWGADHIGYVPRMKAAARAIGYSEETLKIVIYQLVTLKRGGKRVSASTRSGEFIPLKEVLEEVGKDAARFFFLSRSADSHLDFDLELAKKQTPENPVFYVQYAHARICSILRKAKEKGFSLPHPQQVELSLLKSSEEILLYSPSCDNPG